MGLLLHTILVAILTKNLIVFVCLGLDEIARTLHVLSLTVNCVAKVCVIISRILPQILFFVEIWREIALVCPGVPHLASLRRIPHICKGCRGSGAATSVSHLDTVAERSIEHDVIVVKLLCLLIEIQGCCLIDVPRKFKRTGLRSTYLVGHTWRLLVTEESLGRWGGEEIAFLAAYMLLLAWSVARLVLIVSITINSDATGAICI